VRTDSSYLCARDPRVQIGLGAIDAAPDIDIVWPDGRSRTIAGLSLDRVHRIDPPEEDAGAALETGR
jgi:hypothetical protein